LRTKHLEQITPEPDSGQCVEHYEIKGDVALRNVILPDGRKTTTKIVVDPNVLLDYDARSIFEYSFLRLKVKPKSDHLKGIFSADLFCGCGCLSLGAAEACEALGKSLIPIVAIDNDQTAISVYKDNFNPKQTRVSDISTIIDGNLGSEPTLNELQFLQNCFGNSTDLGLLLAGPPCQGYSSLNNYTRKKDKSNILYERVARFVELVHPENVLIENVPTVIHSEEKVVDSSIQLMEKEGYFVDEDVVNLVDIGVPQSRKRHVVVASKRKKISIAETIEKHKVKHRRTFAWAAADLQDEPAADLLTIPTKHSPENMKRIEYLHSHNVDDLPNDMRPVCHQKDHGYKSMYGRIKMNMPAQTITSGFPSPGQGRFIHPTKNRTITPHEAARLQFIPDYFKFSASKTRRSLALMIGNAAPMELSYIFCLELLV
jgi:DNA (cytosine-5)-methyltransferase 1